MLPPWIVEAGQPGSKEKPSIAVYSVAWVAPHEVVSLA